ncbi:RNA methyltransferase [Pseudactinotalea sp. HY158]|uniref:TrmH family RNA methyltransferase n=1 Tax=Pseudactinotalea sp. HY158 TaxID=2654547 RepID=UPI00129C23BC|nr:RNA methyltransferase [Pseudactinotalea sp. HY158]QGH69795.1 RNA methyltransferase [Pseudactinotalea sp. HY158]
MTNPKADRVRRIRALATASGRRRQGAFLVEGPQGVREAVRHAPRLVRDLYLSVEASQRHAEILDDATRHDLYVHLCSPDVIDAMSADAQGLVAVLSSDAHSLEAILEGAGDRSPRLVAALVEARDPGNAGTVIRAADAAGADGVVLTAGSVDVENPKVLRASAGSAFHLPVATGARAEELIETARAAGLQVLAASGAGDVSLDDLAAVASAEAAERGHHHTPQVGIDLTRPTLWLFGNEAHGLIGPVLDAADAVVRIPIYGEAESLNLAMAATLCLYASARAQRD